MNVVQCKGEGQGSCKRCSDNGKWNSIWMCFLYKIEGHEGCYCRDCVNEIQIKTAKAEAIKEFADKLPEIIPHFDDGHTTMECVVRAVKNLVKELTNKN